MALNEPKVTLHACAAHLLDTAKQLTKLRSYRGCNSIQVCHDPLTSDQDDVLALMLVGNTLHDLGARAGKNDQTIECGSIPTWALATCLALISNALEAQAKGLPISAPPAPAIPAE